MRTKNFAEKFRDERRCLIKKYPEWKSIKITYDNKIPIIELDSPQLLAGFTGYLKFQLKKKNRSCKVFFRGEANYHDSCIPSLFRADSNTLSEKKINALKKAFDELVLSTPHLYKSARFTQIKFSPIFQHYGIKSDWIDLVDNIFIALWFARRNCKSKFCYIKFFATDWNGVELKVIDLREEHSSLSLRPHCQHGISVTKNVTWSTDNIDFNTNLIAIVKVPINNLLFKLNGNIFIDKYMFPNEKLDNTLKLFKKKKFSKKLKEVTKKYQINLGELGKIE